VGFGCRDSDPATNSVDEEEFDYGNKLGVSAGMIFGLKKSVFNSADFATIAIDTYATAPS